MQGTANRAGADAGQAALGPARRIPQRGQRPGRRAIPCALRHPGHFGQHAPLLGLSVADPMAAAMAWHHRSQAFAVEPRHPARNGVADLAPNQASAS
jgi:hypothetical protein